MKLSDKLTVIIVLLGALTLNIFTFLSTYNCVFNCPFPHLFPILPLNDSLLFFFSELFSIAALVFAVIKILRKSDDAHVIALSITVLISGFVLFLSFFGEVLPLTPEICMMPAGINCQKTYLSTDGTLNVTLVNGLQKTIHIVGMKCTQESDPTDFEAQDISASMGQAFSPTVPLTCYDSQGIPVGTLSDGEQYSGKIYLKYYFVDEGSENIRTIVGTVTVRAQTPY